MKSLLFIKAYAKTEDKRNILRKCIESCKLLGFDIALTSHSVLPEDIVNSVQYYVYDFDNRFNNGEHHLTWKRIDNITVNRRAQRSHEFPIIKLIRNVLCLAKANGYEFVYGTDFDNIYHPDDIKKLLELKERMIREEKDFIFFHPSHASWTLDGEPLVGIYYDMYVYGGRLDKFFEIFDSYFPKTLEEYNKVMAYMEKGKPQLFEYYFYDAFKQRKRNTVIVDSYVKDYLDKSSINESNINSHNTVVEILPSNSRGHFLHISNEGINDYVFDVYINNNKVVTHVLSAKELSSSFVVIELVEECDVRVDILENNILVETHNLPYRKDKHPEYARLGNIELS